MHLQAVPTDAKRQLMCSVSGHQIGGNCSKYISKFEMYSVLLLELLKDILENKFFNTLKLAIRAVINRKLVGLEDIKEQAQLIEDQEIAVQLAEEWESKWPKIDINKTTQGSVGKTTQNVHAKPNNCANEPIHTRAIALPETSGLKCKEPAFKRLSDAEF